VEQEEQGPYHTAAELPVTTDRQGLETLGLTWTFTVLRSECCTLTQRYQSPRDGLSCLFLSLSDAQTTLNKIAFEGCRLVGCEAVWLL
jgi:hypothetical protein